MTGKLVKVEPAMGLAKGQPNVDDVLREFYSRRSKATLLAYKQDLARFRDFIGVETDAAVAKMLFAGGPGAGNALLLRWRNAMEEANVAPLTINRRLTAIRSLVKLGRTLGVVTWAFDVQGVKGAVPIRDTRGPELVDVRRLLSTRHGLMEDAILQLMFTRGLRSIEVRELRLEHCLTLKDRSTVMIRGKGRKGLTAITLAPSSVAALLTWLKVRGDEPGYVFTREGDEPGAQLNHPYLWRLVKRCGAKVGIKLWPHALRHSAITTALDAAHGDVRRVQKFSRHADVKNVLKYDDDRRDFGGELAGALDELSKKQ